ncbi:hypothetical protein LX87_05695 [Larkinella arboricola]|uniref:NYN domain-containing protein n=1 Tax=Larkinella arboricola TaxID=643671 RepID=A0A327WHK3_LARAB|nr:hypothetical protein [Larkinella arboricola]RAJ89758.1 hypothetical protein LX87_05695 [Larkinella arboricola]
MANIILVDYDNLERGDRNKGLVYVTEKIIDTVAYKDLNGRNILLRLYGGWYENNKLSRAAQDLSIEVSANFPRPILLNDRTNKVIVNIEMAYSLISQPHNHLFHTFRTRGAPTGLHCHDPFSISGCLKTGCPTKEVYNFVKNDICNACNTISPSDIFYRREQKLVDTMLTSDLIHSANTNTVKSNIAIVSSDDDFWPGILTALYSGVKIFHIHTKGRRTNPFYLNTANSNYFQKQLQ